MADPAPRPSNELRTRIGIGLALIAVAIGALLAGGAIFWILVSVAGLPMQGEWADLAEAPAQNKRLSLFAISVPLAIMSPFAAGVSFLAFDLMAAAFLFVAIVCRSVRLGAGIYYVGSPLLSLLFLREQPEDRKSTRLNSSH